MKILSLVVPALMMASLSIQAQTRYSTAAQFIVPTKSSVPGLASNAASAKAFDFSAAGAKSLFFCSEKAIVLSNFPVSMTEQRTVRLQEFRSPFGLETHVWKLGTNGTRTEVRLPESRCFSGSIEKEPGSNVFVVMSGDDLYASIERASGLMVQLAPATTKEQTEILLDNTHGPAPTFYCGNEDLPQEYTPIDYDAIRAEARKNAILNDGEPAKRDMLIAKVAIETDRFLWAKMGKNEQKITAYLYTIWATVGYVYEREVSVGFTLGDILIHTDDDPDPYTQNAKGDIKALLQEFTDYWIQNYTGVSRSVAVLYTVPGKTEVGGIAWLTGLCKKDMGYAACGIRTNSIMPTQGYQWDAYVTAHEVGHTFWAKHTHDCVWNPPLDSCVSTTGNIPVSDACWNGTPKPNKGSIMSYCHLISENPGPRYTFLFPVDTVVRFGAEHSGCLVSPTAPTLMLAEPIGGPDQIIRADTGVVVQWLSANVNQVNIEYSLDGGKNFSPIAEATNLPATDRYYRWYPAPGTSSTQTMVRIFDPANPSVADTSYVVFTLGSASLKLQGWTGGRRVGRKTTEQIAWTRTFITTNSVQFSATGTEPWSDVATDTNVTQMQWRVPDIDAPSARIRLVGANGTVIELSEAFAIGTPTLSILSPKSGDTACAEHKVLIRWQSDFIPSLDIRYSRNDGSTFPLTQVVNSSADGTAQSIVWSIPAGKTADSARVRLSNSADGTQMVLSDRFVIGVCSYDGVGSVNESPEQNGLRITRIFPTPASSSLSVSLSNARPLSAYAQIDVVSNDAKVVLSMPAVLQSGNQVIQIPLSTLVAGSYLMVLHSDGAELSLPFVIAR